MDNYPIAGTLWHKDDDKRYHVVCLAKMIDSNEEMIVFAEYGEPNTVMSLERFTSEFKEIPKVYNEDVTKEST